MWDNPLASVTNHLRQREERDDFSKIHVEVRFSSGLNVTFGLDYGSPETILSKINHLIGYHWPAELSEEDGTFDVLLQ